jgi:hypothetical protein
MEEEEFAFDSVAFVVVAVVVAPLDGDDSFVQVVFLWRQE